MVDITNGVTFNNKPKEHIQFGEFNSLEYDMWLVDRAAPTPSEKEATESVAFMHGHYDFSNVLGERIFENRPITYTFHMQESVYRRRKLSQTLIENELMRQFKNELHDTYSPRYKYNAKCVGVNVQDDHAHNRLIITVEFDAYPFKIDTLPEGHDIWDEIIFDLDVFQDVKFEVNGRKEITLHNPGTPTVYPTVIASDAMQIECNGRTQNVKAGTTLEANIPLASGENDLIVTGTGTIEFEFYKELI